jgi:microcystin degradation protein MlrC
MAMEEDASPLAGALEVARDKGWEVLPVVDMRAMPGATASDEVVGIFWEAFRTAAEEEKGHGIDGVFLILHGAMVSESLLDVEGEILGRVRGIEHLSAAPVCGVLDLHANFTEAMAACSECLVSYKENPHTDAKEAAKDAALSLDRLMKSGEKPITVWEHPPLLWPPSGTGTDEDPMQTLERRARELEAEDTDIVAANVFAGFAFADVPEAGVSFSVVSLGDSEKARTVSKELASLAWSLKEEGDHPSMKLEEAMARLREHREGPVLIVEPSDNIGGGAPGDSTHLLRAFIEHEVDNAGVVINDPQVVRSLRDVAIGEHREVLIGAKSGPGGGEPLPLDVEVISKSAGRFQLEDRQSHLASVLGLSVDMGRCVLVRHGGVTILLTSRGTPPFDLGQWRSQGVNPESLFVIGIKAAVAHRRAYDPIAKASYTVDSPGPCAENLRRLPYQRVKRPVYPLDGM